MPVEMRVIQDLSGREAHAPVVVCDHCNEPIEDARDGNYEWDMEASLNGPSDLFFTHKACSLMFRSAHPNVTGSGELRLLPLFMSRNLEIDEDGAKALANIMDEVDP